jgi:hypothetical protein
MPNGNGGDRAAAMAARESAWRALADQALGRTTGTVFLESLTHTFASTGTLRPTRPLDAVIPIKHILLRLSGRVVIGTADYTTGALEIPQSLIQRVRLSGRHREFGLQTLWDISGASLFAIWPRMWQFAGGFSFSGTTTNAFDALPTIPFTAQMSTAQGTTDFDIFYFLPTSPMIGGGPYESRWCAPYYLRDEDWGRTLRLEIDMPDNSGLGDPAATTTTTWTAYGSASGSPSLDIYTVHSLMGPFARIPGRGLVIRTEQEASPVRESVSTNVSLYELRPQITTNVIVKTGGIITSGITSGVEVFSSLDDRHLDRTQIVLNNKRLRDTNNNRVAKMAQMVEWNTIHPEGYMVFSFIDAKQPLTALRADKASGLFEIRTDVTSAIASGDRQHVIQEIVTGGPFPA